MVGFPLGGKIAVVQVVKTMCPCPYHGADRSNRDSWLPFASYGIMLKSKVMGAGQKRRTDIFTHRSLSKFAQSRGQFSLFYEMFYITKNRPIKFFPPTLNITLVDF